MLHLLTDEVRRDPYPLYEQLRSQAPVLQAPGAGMWLVFDYEGVKRALTDHDAFASAVTPPTGKAPDFLVFTDPPRHTALRAIILRAFTPRSIAGLEPRVRELSRALLEPARARGELDLVADYAAPLPTYVIAEMLGIPADDLPRFLRWSASILDLSHALSGDASAAAAIAALAGVKAEIAAYLDALCEARRRAPEGDLLSRLVAAEVDGERLTAAEILSFFQLLLAAGTETTTNLIANAIVCLHAHPEQRARLLATPALLPTAVEEVVRYRSPLQIVFREARRDVAMHGRTIPAGALVLAVIGAANRDPAAFAEPDRFDVARDPNPHLGFGHGIHFCLGAALSRLEARVALADLLALEGLALADDAPWEPRKPLIVHGPQRLPVRFAPRE